MNGDTQTFVLKSRYGSGKTTFKQRLLKYHNPERVLFITYRQTSALDTMKNFGKMQFKNYLDACSKSSIWDAPRLILQIDSLMDILLNDGPILQGDEFDLRYDMIYLDESEGLMNHFDEGTMNQQENDRWYFLHISSSTPLRWYCCMAI